MALWDRLPNEPLTGSDILPVFTHDAVDGVIVNRAQLSDGQVERLWVETAGAFHQIGREPSADSGWERTEHIPKGSDDDLHGAPLSAFKDADTISFSRCVAASKEGDLHYNGVPPVEPTTEDGNPLGEGGAGGGGIPALNLSTEGDYGPDDLDEEAKEWWFGAGGGDGGTAAGAGAGGGRIEMKNGSSIAYRAGSGHGHSFTDAARVAAAHTLGLDVMLASPSPEFSAVGDMVARTENAARKNRDS